MQAAEVEAQVENKYSETEDESFGELRGKQRKYRVCYLNARSLINKLDAVSEFVENIGGADFICVSETWFGEGDAKYANINGYELLHSDRIGKEGRGVAIYIKNGYATRQISKKSTFTFDILKVSLQKKQIKVEIILVYNSHKSNVPLMLGDLEVFLSSSLNQNVILLGDFNLDLFDAKVVSSSYVEMLNTYNFKWLNMKFPTRESVTTKT